MFEPDRINLVQVRYNRWQCRVLQVGPGECGNVPCEPKHAEAVTAIRRQIKIEYCVRQPQVGCEILPRFRILFEFHDAIGFIAQIEFDGGTKHAVRLDPANLRTA